MSDYSHVDMVGLAPRGSHPLPPTQVYQPVNHREENPPNRQRQGPSPYAFAFSEEELRREPEDEEFLYKFPETYTGLVILIINSQFDHEKRRDYAEQDLDKMQNVFGGLGFQIRLMRNFTTQQLHNNLKEVSKENMMKHIGCLACVISSHGSEEVIGKGEKDEDIPDHITVYEQVISTKDGQIRTKTILEMFDDDNCRHLKGKPRLFFIQACRSRVDVIDPMLRRKAFDKGFTVTVDTTEKIMPGQQLPQNNKNSPSNQTPSGQQSWAEFYEHNEPCPLQRTTLSPPVCLNHFLVMFASMPEQVAWSDGRGGWLLNALHDVLEERIRKKNRFSLMEALVAVNGKVAVFYQSKSADQSKNNMKSVSYMECKLTKEMYLEPRLTQAF